MANDGSDVKVPWELSRLQFLPVLGKAWRLSRSQRYREVAKALAGNWVKQNPVGVGVNWMLAMEAALRGTSLCLLLELLSPFSGEDETWLETIAKSLWQHLLFIEAHNEFSHFARSNHYLSNIVGLLHLSSSLHGPEMAQRREAYSRMVENEILCQVRNDGWDHEASTGYHLLVMQMFIGAGLLFRTRQRESSPQFRPRLRQMCTVLESLADADGGIPQIGDCDDGRVELLTADLEQLTSGGCIARDSQQASSWIAVGKTLLGEPSGGRDDDLAWYGLRHIPVADTVPPVSHVFRESGVAVARRGWAELIFVAMPNGISGRGSHTHNDKLSLLLRLAGHELFCDSGTYGYSRDIRLRNSFRSSRAHNTVIVDDEEQNRYSNLPDGLFRMSDDAEVGPIECEESGAATRFRSFHRGYKRLGVIHERSVALTRTVAVVDDQLAGSGRHKAEIAWHVPEPWQVEVARPNDLEAVFVVSGPLVVRVKISSSVRCDISTAPAQISRAYGATSPATRISITAVGLLPCTFKTQVFFEEL